MTSTTSQTQFWSLCSKGFSKWCFSIGIIRFWIMYSMSYWLAKDIFWGVFPKNGVWLSAKFVPEVQKMGGVPEKKNIYEYVCMVKDSVYFIIFIDGDFLSFSCSASSCMIYGAESFSWSLSFSSRHLSLILVFIIWFFFFLVWRNLLEQCYFSIFFFFFSCSFSFKKTILLASLMAVKILFYFLFFQILAGQDVWSLLVKVSFENLDILNCVLYFFVFVGKNKF